MSIEPIEPVESVGSVTPPSVVDGPWWTSTIEPVGRIETVEAIAPAERDPRAEALGIAQHGTAYIPTPVVPTWHDLRRRRRR